MRVLFFVVLAIVLVLAYVRLAPIDPQKWNTDIAAPGFAPDPKWAAFCPAPGSHLADSGVRLAALDAIAMATPRTTRLAGRPGQDRISWVTRSALMGYPDVTTAAQLADGRICVIARQRFGQRDGGVNEQRLGGWLQQLYRLSAAPDLRWDAS